MGDARIPDRRHPTRQHPQRAPNPMRQPTRGREPSPPLSLPCTSDELDLHKFSHACFRLVAKIPHGTPPHEALARFAPAAAEFVRDLEGDDEDSRVTVQRAYFSLRTQTVTQPFVCTPDESDRVRRATDSSSFVYLHRWGGQAAAFFGNGPALKQYSLHDLPLGVDHELVAAQLHKHAGIEVEETLSVLDGPTGLPRADAARLLVTAGTFLPGSILLKLPGGTIHTVQVRAISALPPAPGEQAPRATYADAAAGHGPPPAPVPAGAAWGRAAPAPAASGAAAPARGPVGAGAGTGLRLVGRPGRSPSPHSDSDSSHWRTAAGGASPRQHSLAGGGAAAAAAAAAGRASPRSRSPPAACRGPTAHPAAGQPSGGQASPRSRSPPAARRGPTVRPAAGQPTGGQDSPCGSAAGSRPVSPTAQAAAKRLRTLNPFATLTDQADMDATPGSLLAPQLPADPTAPNAATA